MHIMVKKWLTEAKRIGFDEAAFCEINTLIPMESVREMCAADRCRAYGRNWTCPPECGTLENCADQISQHEHGILLQTVGYMKKMIDSNCYRETETRHNRMLIEFAEAIRDEFPNALVLGAGGCRVCKICAYPKPCRFPKKAFSSMEAYGLFVTQICRDNGVPYYHGAQTITYTASVLF